jgi:hypothetical protein
MTSSCKGSREEGHSNEPLLVRNGEHESENESILCCELAATVKEIAHERREPNFLFGYSSANLA